MAIPPPSISSWAPVMLPGLWHWPPRWEQASAPSVTDLALVPFFALLFPLLRFFLDRLLFEVRVLYCCTCAVALTRSLDSMHSFIHLLNMLVLDAD